MNKYRGFFNYHLGKKEMKALGIICFNIEKIYIKRNDTF
jgi:hypothetical protein